MIESGLRAAGHRTGLFTSPHLVEPTERIRIAGLPVTAEQLRRRLRPRPRLRRRRCCEPGASICTPPISKPSPPWRCPDLREARVDIVVLEVGLGGRLDATNVVMPELVRDHAHRFRSRSFPRQEPGIHRRRKGRHPQARRAGGLCAAAARSRRACSKRAPRNWACPSLVRPRRGRSPDLAARRPRQPVPPRAGDCPNPLPAGRRAPGGERQHRQRSRCDASASPAAAIEQGIAHTVLARPPGARLRKSRNHPRWRAQSRRRPRPGRVPRPLLRPAAASG